MNPRTSAVQLGSSSSINPVNTRASERLHAPPVSRKRRSPNAFILFRSYYIANKRVPPEIVHQNDVSRYVAEVWKTKLTPSDRAVFFKMAEEEKIRFEIEGPREPVKKRRSRSKKACQTSTLKSTTDSYLPPSHTSPDYKGSVSLSAPQPTHAIPPSLLNWGSPAEHYALIPEEQAYASSQYLVPSTDFSAAGVGLESHAPLMDLGFNALYLDALLSGMDIAFDDFSCPEFLSHSSFEIPF
ncbi:uncharacterized protein FOMMEDRAFT_24719 [Fomitiporia mediterranea MF3/22]|uniref:uncharacterized protein n=1 Tax=Fomitiporia mediterranea (strain MF3/22) TaxID=694068 RepID=UPI0004408285|nr:uncharacterized protein FOMMEDRAFT_24719 [Fomitiporia mediterranea MF3/22]EJD07311.1 hypothetical protein FOMMEDRAFT_24719 [Fomitiporia mediterranea MF3/22]